VGAGHGGEDQERYQESSFHAVFPIAVTLAEARHGVTVNAARGVPGKTVGAACKSFYASMRKDA
jgi:hypothetical protein